MLHGGTEYKCYNCAKELGQFFCFGYNGIRIGIRIKNDIEVK